MNILIRNIIGKMPVASILDGETVKPNFDDTMARNVLKQYYGITALHLKGNVWIFLMYSQTSIHCTMFRGCEIAAVFRICWYTEVVIEVKRTTAKTLKKSEVGDVHTVYWGAVYGGLYVLDITSLPEIKYQQQRAGIDSFILWSKVIFIQSHAYY